MSSVVRRLLELRLSVLIVVAALIFALPMPTRSATDSLGYVTNDNLSQLAQRLGEVWAQVAPEARPTSSKASGVPGDSWADGTPVILVPGTGGTMLYSQYETVIYRWNGAISLARVNYNIQTAILGKVAIWKDYTLAPARYDDIGRYTYPTFAQVGPGALPADPTHYGLVDPFIDTYTDFIEAMTKAGIDLHVFTYDSATTPIEQNARNLTAYVNWVLSTTKAKQVRIIAHSQGCLITRWMMEFWDPALAPGLPPVSEAVLVAPPNHGVVETYGMCKDGYIESRAMRALVGDLLGIPNVLSDDPKVKAEIGGRLRSECHAITDMFPDLPYLYLDGSTSPADMSDQAYPPSIALTRLNAESARTRLNSAKIYMVQSESTPTALESQTIEHYDISSISLSGLVTDLWVMYPTTQTVKMPIGDGTVLPRGERLPDDVVCTYVTPKAQNGSSAEVPHQAYFSPEYLSTWTAQVGLLIGQ